MGGVRGKLNATGCSGRIGVPCGQWRVVGSRLNYIQGAVLWWWGDLLNYWGKHYGDTYKAAMEQSGYDYQTLADAKWVSSKFGISLRNENLTWNHHRLVVALDPPDQDRLLREAESNHWSTRELRKASKEAPRLPTPELPEGKYRTIVVDPASPSARLGG